jgi:hypothetical protein
MIVALCRAWRPGLRKSCLVASAVVVLGGLVVATGCTKSPSASTTSTTRGSTTTSRATTSTASTVATQPTLAPQNHAYRPVKGLYLTAYSASSPKKLAGFVQIADQTEINAFVIDVKDNSGYVMYNTDAPRAKSLGLIFPQFKNIDSVIATLVQHNIMPIARIVCFQDPQLAKKRPDWAIKSKKTGGNWLDPKKAQYTNPYNHEVWEYLVEVAEDAAKHGFREIQFDYVRFPSGNVSDAVYPGAGTMSKADAIAGFLAFARARLDKLGVWLSADVFGVILQVKNDSGIGQKVEELAANVDIVCPMIYPSHYAKGNYGFVNPNGNPYGMITAAVKDMKTRLAGTGAKGRPWLQDFSLGQPHYGVAQVKAEIKAVEDQGINEWILWNASNKYTVAALAPN